MSPKTSKASESIAPFKTLLYGLCALGLAASGWAIFLWNQLLLARSGSDPFCGFGDSGDCAALWDAEFAAKVHDMTGLPVAGWGLVWGIAAAVLPLFALTASKGSWKKWLQGCRLVAWLGLAGVAGLLLVSALAGLFCVSCSITYVLTLAYGGGALLGLPKFPKHGAWLPVAATLGIAWLALLLPGSSTPKNMERAGQKALASSQEGGQSEAAPDLETFIGDLDANLQQGLSDTLARYRVAPQEPGQPGPRHLAYGDANAPVLITEFTDTLCSHCATLHGNLTYLETVFGPEQFAVDARHFPLDGNCNAHLDIRGPESVRCVAAKARLCVDQTGQGNAYSAVLYGNQRGLTTTQVYELAQPYMGRNDLAACIDSDATRQALASDVDFAWLFKPHGTPLVLINGRQGNPFGPFLYSMVLAGGDADHPAFAALPEPSPEALQPHSHDGHQH